MPSQISPLSVRRIVWLLSLVHGIQGQPVRFIAQHEKLEEGQFLSFLSISILLVLLGGVFAGLTLGLMGQDEVYLKVISSSGSPREQKLARRVLDLISKGKHWLLVTLLLSNVITNETLPIVLDRCLGGGWQAVVSSTVLIVIFGEIIPQSVCVRYGLEVGAFFCPFVLCLMYVMYPVAYPIALLLDWILGEDHGTMYKKSGLKTLVTLHRTMGVDRLTKDEVTIISAVLDLKEKKVSEIMTPIENVFTMSADTILNDDTVEEIFNSGFSRVPIYLPGEPTNFIGMLLVRVLISYDPEDCLPISHFPLATLPETSPNTSCLNILNYFQEGKSHMCVVSSEPGSSAGALGVLTLEDVIEELIGEEIVDESDIFVDIHQRIMREQPGPLSKRHITSYLHSLYTTSHRHSTDFTEEDQPLLNNHAQTDKVSKSPPHNLPPHEKPVIPSNLASNPLKVANPYVKIKDPAELNGRVRSPTFRNRDGSPNYGGMATSPKLHLDEALEKLNGRNAHSVHNGGTIPSIEDRAINREHANASQRAMEHTLQTGESTHVTTTKQETPQPTTPEEQDSKISSSSTDVLTPKPERATSSDPETRMISSSYRSTKNGIVESVITVKGVPKTIIAPAKNWDESQEVIIDEGRNIHDNGAESDESGHHSSSARPSKSRRGSMFSLFRNPSAGGSASSSRPRSTHTSASSDKLNSEGLGDNDGYLMKDKPQ